jgi:hypothetical protein
VGIPPGPLNQAADAAEDELRARGADLDVARLRRLLLREVPYRLGVHQSRVAVFVTVASLAIGIAVIRSNGSLVAVAGLKADALAGPETWLAARIAEIEAAP